MRKRLSVIVAVLLCFFMLADTIVCFAYDAHNSAALDTSAEYVEGEAIAVLRDDLSDRYTAKKNADEVYGEDISLLDSYVIEGEDGETGVKAVALKSRDMSTQELVSELEENPAVEYVFPNYRMTPDSLTDDTYSDSQWALNNTGQNGGTVGSDINADALWSKAAQSDEEQVVAIIDSGIDATHEDLKDVLWHNTCSSLKGDYGYDFANHDAVPEDVDGHGTHCAGTIAASANNSKGISGVNAGNVKIMALKVDDGNNTYYTSAIFEAYEYITKAKNLGVNIAAVNCSFSVITDNISTKQAYEKVFNKLGELGIITCVSAGNQSLDLNTYYESEGKYIVPACCDSEYCLTVAACDENDNLLSFSNYGDKYVDVAAPGVHILSTVPDYTFNPSIYSTAQREELCAYYQDYTDISDTTAFGVGGLNMYAFDDYKLSVGRNISQSFGVQGGSLIMINPDEKYGREFSFYIEMPFELDNTEDSYYISFVSKFLGDAYAAAVDLPADYDVQNNFTDLALSGVKYGKHASSARWFNKTFKSDPNAEGYIKNTSRKLVFCYLNVKGPVLLDCIGISRQGADETSFGKYDFKEGTSMATPYVTGTVALLRNAYSGYSTRDIINIIKTTGRVSSNLTGSVCNGKVLSLEDTESYVSEVNVPAVGGLSATDITKDSISLKWDGVGLPRAEYYIEYKTAKGGWTACEPVTELSAVLTDLLPKTTYTFRIRAKAVNKFGEYSPIFTASTIAEEVIILDTPEISKPQKSDLMYSGKSGIRLKISKLDSNADGVQIYVYNSSGSVKCAKYLTRETAVSKGCVVTGLKRTQFYYARLRAYKVSSAGVKVFSPWSGAEFFAVGTKPSAKILSSGIKVSWSKVVGAASYTVYCSANGRTFRKYRTLRGTSLVIGRNYLKKNTTYRIKVTAAKKGIQSLDNMVKTVKTK